MKKRAPSRRATEWRAPEKERSPKKRPYVKEVDLGAFIRGEVYK